MLPAIYQSNFHPTAFFFFIGKKNERKTYMTLIRRMHSLGRGEGRVGWLSNGKYMHWLQDELGLGSRWEWKLCPRAALLSETRQERPGKGGGCHWSSPYVTMSVCLQFVLWEACYQKKRKEKKTRRKETEIIETERETTTTTTNHHHHHQYGPQGISRDVMQSRWNDILRNPSPRESQGRNASLSPDFLRTSWHWLQEARPVRTTAWKGRSNFPGGLQVPPQAGSLPTGTFRVESTGAGTDARRPTPDWGAGGWGEAGTQ